jgi:rhodanese-related sulfurtransferase
MKNFKKVQFLVLGIFLSVFLVGCNKKEAPTIGMEMDKKETMKTEEKDIVPEEEMIQEEMLSYMDISVEEAKKMIDDKSELVVVDVSPKYAEGHIPGAVNYYVGDGSLDEAIPGLDKEADYLVYCHVDSASILGAQKLIDAGFKSVYRLEGNYQAWVDAGHPVEK